MPVLLKLMLLASGIPLYLTINVGIAWLLLHRGKSIGILIASVLYGSARFIEVQLVRLTTCRVWVYAGVHLICLGCVMNYVSSPRSVWMLVQWLTAYVFVTVALAISVLSRIPVIEAWSKRATAKFIFWTIPILTTFAAKLLGTEWTSDLVRVSSVNLPYASIAATALVAGAFLSLILYALAALYEFGMFVAIFQINGNKRERWFRGMGLVLLCVASFMSALAAGAVALGSSSPSFGSVLLAHVAYTFDAAPADHCDLTERERKELAASNHPIKAVFLSTSQERALLVRPPEALFEDVKLNAVSRDESLKRQLKIERVSVCYPPASASLDASQPSR